MQISEESKARQAARKKEEGMKRIDDREKRKIEHQVFEEKHRQHRFRQSIRDLKPGEIYQDHHDDLKVYYFKPGISK